MNDDNIIQLTRCGVTVVQSGTKPMNTDAIIDSLFKAKRLRDEAAELIKQAAKLIDQSIDFDEQKENWWDHVSASLEKIVADDMGYGYPGDPAERYVELADVDDIPF